MEGSEKSITVTNMLLLLLLHKDIQVLSSVMHWINHPGRNTSICHSVGVMEVQWLSASEKFSV